MSPSQAWELFDRHPAVHVAGIGDNGRPLLRVLNHVVLDDALWFHGDPRGAKNELLGKPVVASIVEDLGRVPSYAQHPTRACPATTWYRSAQLAGTLEEVTDVDLKARALQALTTRLQPEGGFTPIEADLPMYRKVVQSLRVMRLKGSLSAKQAVGQNKPPAVRLRIIEALWARGKPGDVDLIEAMRAVVPTDPPFLIGPAGLRLRCTLDEVRLPEILSLLEGTYWNHHFTPHTVADAQRGSAAWVGAETPDGTIVGMGRAVSDGARYAWIGDVIVREPFRRRGVASALMTLLLDHPAIRRCPVVTLATRHPALYERFGFVTEYEGPGRWVMARRSVPVPGPAETDPG